LLLLLRCNSLPEMAFMRGLRDLAMTAGSYNQAPLQLQTSQPAYAPNAVVAVR